MKILLASDGSKHALHAVKYAVKLVRQLSSASNSITLVTFTMMLHCTTRDP